MADRKRRPRRRFDAYADQDKWEALEEEQFEEHVESTLGEQAAEEANPRPFDPTFTGTVQEKAWLKGALGGLFEEHWFDDILYRVKPGKEATVYCCQAGPGTRLQHLAAKVYRPRMFRAMRNDWVYKQGRTLRDPEGKLAYDSRSQRAVKRQAERGRQIDMASWCRYEFDLLTELHAAGADVPKPFACDLQAILMEYVGDVPQAAPTLHEVRLSRQEAQELFDRLIRNVTLFLSHSRIHADLSAFNVLYWNGQIRIIDFPQAVDAETHPDAYSLLARDIDRLCRYFSRQGVRCDPVAITADLWKRFNQGEL
jgi:RIO kinase 1